MVCEAQFWLGPEIKLLSGVLNVFLLVFCLSVILQQYIEAYVLHFPIQICDGTPRLEWADTYACHAYAHRNYK